MSPKFVSIEHEPETHQIRADGHIAIKHTAREPAEEQIGAHDGGGPLSPFLLL